ncbi:hypothetical protein [Pseudogemmobacter sp. W21_MBD1_M6]|uniref:hypothetical protein n=1 Tax=Pseudogemmobacter sp. W21_MBD1_M6 TaxID=3240271 RepID=UPI003F9A143D
MMKETLSVPELVATAQAKAKTSQDRIEEIRNAMDGQNGSDTQVEDLRAATVALELNAVDIFSVFEARMQRHFKRGPFSRKLKAMLLAAGQADLADRVHQHYLAINVLKHGTGASYRELLTNKSTLFIVKPANDLIADNSQASESLLDVSMPGFFDELTATILEAYHFLEKK